jgi:hypothetical protein
VLLVISKFTNPVPKNVKAGCAECRSARRFRWNLYAYRLIAELGRYRRRLARHWKKLNCLNKKRLLLESCKTEILMFSQLKIDNAFIQ